MKNKILKFYILEAYTTIGVALFISMVPLCGMFYVGLLEVSSIFIFLFFLIFSSFNNFSGFLKSLGCN